MFSFMFILTSALRVLTDFCRFPLAKTEYGMFQLDKKKLLVARKGWNLKQGIRDIDMNITSRSLQEALKGFFPADWSKKGSEPGSLSKQISSHPNLLN